MLDVIARLTLYVGVTMALGEAALQNTHDIGTTHHHVRDSRRVVLVGWCIAVLGVLLLHVAQARDMEVSSLSELRTVVTQTTWGRGWSVLASGTLLGLVVTALGGSRVLRAACAIAVGVAMGGLGHAAADETWPFVARALDASHVLASGAWIGGLFLVMQRQRSNSSTPPRDGDRASWMALSRMATIAAPVVVLSGIGAAWRRLSGATLSTVIASDYGRLLAVKVALALVVLWYGFTHRRRVKSGAIPSDGSVSAELLFALAIFATTALLTGTSPPGE